MRTPKDEAISRLKEAEVQLLAMTPETLRREQTLAVLIARDVQKAREFLESDRG